MDLKTYIESGRGLAAKLALDIGVSPSYLSQMASGSSAISPERCVDIERATGGTVTRKDLRHDDWQKIWPELNYPIDGTPIDGSTVRETIGKTRRVGDYGDRKK